MDRVKSAPHITPAKMDVMVNPISSRIDIFCNQRRVQASSLIVTIFGAVDRYG
jgi:hypothetical protein